MRPSRADQVCTVPAVPQPLVRAVVVHYRRPDLTARCLQHLAELDWPRDRLEVVLVDNASGDDPHALAGGAARPVRVVTSARNVGFAGGANLGMGDLAEVDLVALVNNDAFVEPAWLTELASAFDRDQRLGGATPQVRFAQRFVELAVRSDSGPRRADPRPLGVEVRGLRVDGIDVWAATRAVSGTFGREARPGGTSEWTNGDARFLVPLAADPPAGGVSGADAGGPADGALRHRTIEVLLAGPAGRWVELFGAPGEHAAAQLATHPGWVAITSSARPAEYLNNAGTELDANHYGVDRGIHQPVSAYPQDEEVFAWSGTAPLLSARHLEGVGLFDEALFAYYEDLDLAWRARRAGWRHSYVAGAVVRHVHGATAGIGSARFTYLNERNRLVVLARHEGRRAGWRWAARHVAVTASYARRDIVGPLARGERPRAGLVGTRLRAVAAFAAARATGLAR